MQPVSSAADALADLKARGAGAEYAGMWPPVQ